MTSETTPRPIPQKMYEVLDRQIQICRELLEMTETEQKALLEMDTQALLAIGARKSNQMTRLENLDTALQDGLHRMFPECVEPVIRFEHFTHLISESDAERVGQYRRLLNDLKSQVLGRNRINRDLARDSKSYLSDALSMITTAISDRPAIYGKKGGYAKSANGLPTLLSKEV